MPEIGAARGVTKHTDLTNKEDAQGVIDHAAGSVTMAKLVQEVQDLINGALQRSGGTMTGNLTIEKAEPQLIFKEPLGIGVISTTLADEADIQITTGGGFLVRTSNAAKSDYVDRLWIPGVTGIADILLQNSNLLLQAGRTVDGVDVSEHVAATPIDHPDASIRPAKLDAIDSPADGEVPSHDSATGKFEWVTAARQVLQAEGITDVSWDETGEWADVPDLSITLATKACKVLIMFSMNVWGDDGYGYTAINIDGARERGQLTTYILGQPMLHAQVLVKQLSAGSHTIKVQWRHLYGTEPLQNKASSEPDGYHRRLIVIEFAGG